jgi:lipid A 3-O-deacylase
MISRINKQSNLAYAACLAAFTFICLISVNPSTAQESVADNTKSYPFSFVFENDLLSSTDGRYSNGVIFSVSFPWLQEDKNEEPDLIYDFFDRFTTVDRENRKKRKTFGFGQAMVTPEDIERADLIEDDIPYAGLLFARLSLDYQNDKSADSYGLLLGVIGPSSKAERAQKFVHEFTDSADPKGWDHQLKDEPAININYEHKWKLFDTLTTSTRVGFDFTSYTGAALGNVLSDVRGGVIARIGNGGNTFPSTFYKGGIGSLPDIGYSTNAPFTFYLMVGAELSYVFHSINLDGNTYQDSHDVDRKPVWGTLYGGIGVGYAIKHNIVSV